MNTTLKAFINVLEIKLAQHANPDIALEQKAYMRNQFEFYGIKPNGDFKTSIFVMDTDDCFDIITEYDEPKFSINDMLNTIKAIAPTFHLINKDNVETFVEELRTK
jgi:hypothetical protein